jgi:hypothetical protein
MTRNMTDFQMSLRTELDAVFQSFSKSITWAIEGEKETFYHGVSDEGKAEIWIYDDEAECRLGDFHRICERADFASLEELRSYFLGTVREKLAGTDGAAGKM